VYDGVRSRRWGIWMVYDLMVDSSGSIPVNCLDPLGEAGLGHTNSGVLGKSYPALSTLMEGSSCKLCIKT
jgi:hypothetical protein